MPRVPSRRISFDHDSEENHVMMRSASRGALATSMVLSMFLAARPALADRVQVFSMQGADCVECGLTVVDRLHKVKGVRHAEFDKQKVELRVKLADRTPDDVVLKTIAAAGYQGFVGAGRGAYLPHPEYPAGADVRLVSKDGSAVGPLDQLRVPGKYTVLDVYADWCGPCRVVDSKLRDLIGRRSDLAVRKLNVVDFDSPLARQLGSRLRALPHVIVFTPSGRRIEFEGAEPAKLDAALAAK
ncbi:MAG TPA: thioredoxin domain-containing protein [Candidatus Udaeobacter sp.]|nr:thioredoxin domain-containing protein [Candidatus Udaeobacter sp.]